MLRQIGFESTNIQHDRHPLWIIVEAPLHINAFAQDTAEAASIQWSSMADQIRRKVPKLATIMDNAEHGVLAYRMFFPRNTAPSCSRRTPSND